MILFGDAGSGKSSIVNMLIGTDAAKVAEDGSRCTFQNECYEANIGDTSFRFHDTAGLDEGDQNRVPHWSAIEALYTLIRQLDGVSLLVYCMRGKIKENSRANWILFNKVICAEQVPAIVAVTGFELDDSEAETRRREIMEAFKTYQVFPKDIVCIVSVRGKHNEFQESYKQSQDKLRALVTTTYKRKPWSTDTEEWFVRIFHNAYTTAICFLPRVRVDFVNTVGNVIDEFIKEAGMKEDDVVKLKTTLLRAENGFLKRNKRRYLW